MWKQSGCGILSARPDVVIDLTYSRRSFPGIEELHGGVEPDLVGEVEAAGYHSELAVLKAGDQTVGQVRTHACIQF